MRMNEGMKKVFSILLCLCMVLQYVPITAFAATEVENLGENTSIPYTDGVTQYFTHDNYLYQVTFTNLKASDRTVSLRIYSGQIYLSLIGTNIGTSLDLYKDRDDQNSIVTTSDFPKVEGGSLTCYLLDAASLGLQRPSIKWANITSEPVVIIRCVSASGPEWSWASDHSAATAVFTVGEADACVTLSADIRAEADVCAQEGQITYTACVTFNGIQYTDEQTVIGILDHNWNEMEGKPCYMTCSRCDAVRVVGHSVDGDHCTVCGDTLYGVLVAGNHISSQNASDVLGDGTMSYDAAKNTLTLTGATVDASELNVPALEITDGTVTLVLRGDNALISYHSVLRDEETGNWDGYPAISIAEGASVIITGDASATLELEGNDLGYTTHDHIPSAAAVSGGSLTVTGGRINTENSSGIRLSGDYTQTGGTVSVGYLEVQNVAVSGGTLESKGWSGISPHYADPNAGGIHGIFAQKNITILGGSVTTSSGVLGHDGNYIGQTTVTGDEVVTYGLYALESITVSGGIITSTGGSGGYVIGDLGELTLGGFMEDAEWIGTPAGAALEAPQWSISDAATFICGSDTSHRGSTQTCKDEQCVFCGEQYNGIDHSYDETTHVCSVCGKVETFTVWILVGSKPRMQSTSTYGQDFTQTFTVPENTHLEINGVYLVDDSTVPVNYTYENGVLTIAAADVPAADVYIDCYHYVEVTFHANGGVIQPEEGYPLPGDTGYAEDGSYWVQSGPFGWKIYLANCAAVSRTGYTFVDWRDASGKVYPMTQVDGAKQVSATEDVTLYAQWQCNHTIGGVEFRDNGDGATHNGYCGECGEPLGNYVERPHVYDETTHQCACGAFKPFKLYEEEQTLDVPYGTALDAALAGITPEKTGYTHTGDWNYYYLDEDGAEISYTGSTMPAMELYAKPVFEPIEYNITWDMAGCSYYVSNYHDGLPTKLAYNVDSYEHNVNFVDITAPEGYEFVRFEDGDGNALRYNVSDHYRLYLTVSGDMTVKAIIQPKTYKATWVSSDGSSISVNFKYGEIINKPDHNPIPGYTFIGWEGYTDGMTMPAKDVTFTAIYQVNQYTITFASDDDSTVASITQDFGTEVTAPAAPSKDGYHFVEWENLPETMPAEDMTIKAVWEAHYGGEATCVSGKLCEACFAEYTDVEADAHGELLYTVSQDGATCTVSCALCQEVLETLTLVVPACKTYGDGESCEVTVLLHDTPVTEIDGEVYFRWENGQWNKLEAAPTNAGTYRAEIYNVGDPYDTSDDFTLYVEYIIAKKELTATVSGSMTKSYDGTNVVPERHSLNIVLNGVIAADTVSASADFAFAGINAGTKTINATNIALSGKDAANYTLKATTASADVGEIIPLDLQYLEPHDYEIVFGAEPEYNGKEQTMTLERFVMCGMDVTYELTGNTGTEAGFYTMTVTATGNFAGTITQTWAIRKKAVTVTAEDQTIFYGDTISNTEFTSAGLIDGHSVTATLTPSTANVTISGTITADAAVITADGTDVTDNYNVSYTSGKLVIEPDTSKIDTLTTENVTSANEEDIKAVQEMMANADSVKDEWNAIANTCEELIGRIDAVEAENARIADAAADYDLNTVKSSDEAAITALIADIDEHLATNNLTDEERSDLEGLKTKCNNLIAKIDGTETLIGQLDKTVDDLDAETVKSSDKAALEQVIADAQTLIDSGNVTKAEKEALKQTQEDAKALIKVIDDTAAENKALTDQAATFDEDTVKSTDKTVLEQLAQDIEDLLDTQNLTEDERTALEAVLEQVEGMIDTINETAEDSKAATDSIEALDPATVTSDDKDELEQAIATIDELLQTDHLTEEERSALEDAKADAEALIDVIEAAQDATDTENTEKVEDVTAENVGPEDKEALEDAKADLEKALKDNAGNYTEEEKKAIQNEIQRIEDAMVALENVEDVTDAITQLPETVEPDDEEAAEKILDAKEAYDELTDHEKSLVDETTKKKLDDLVAALTAYDIIKGDGGKWTKGSSYGLSFTANGPFSKFVGIEVDGKEVASTYYTAESGSTIITLKQSFLKRLSTGEHTITVLYTDGETSGTFKILAQSTSPATGDDSNIFLWSGMLCVSTLGLVALLADRKRRKATK